MATARASARRCCLAPCGGWIRPSRPNTSRRRASSPSGRLRSCSVARQAQLSPRPFCMESCPQRPERKNLIWGNVPTSKTGRLVRHGFVSTVLVLLAMNWSSLIQICTYISHEWAPKHIPTAPYLVKLGYNIFSAYLPIMLVQAVLALLPFLYLGLAVFYDGSSSPRRCSRSCIGGTCSCSGRTSTCRW